MAQLLYRLGHTAYRLKWRFIALWAVILVGISALAMTISKPTSDNFTIPGIDSVTTMDSLQEHFPSAEDPLTAASGTLLINSKDGELTDPEIQESVQALLTDLEDSGVLDSESQLVDPATMAMGMQHQLTEAKAAQGMSEEQIAEDLAAISPLSEDKTTGTVTLQFNADTATDVTDEDRETVEKIIEEHTSDDLTIYATGNAFEAEGELGLMSELIGIAVAAVVLLITFGSMVAAGMPLVTAIVGVGVGIMGIQALTAASDSISSMTPALASMIGLAVGIDYALFILNRYRNELVKTLNAADMSPKELAAALRNTSPTQRAHAMGMAVGTAGSAVVFAGLTVVIALCALSIINIPFLTAMSLTAAGTVLIAVLVALTLLPAITGALGPRVFAGQVPGPKVPDPENEQPTLGLRWVRRVRKHPVLHLIIPVIALGLLAIPATNMQLAMPTGGTERPGTVARDAWDLTEEKFGAGSNATMISLVELENVDEAERPVALQEAVRIFNETDGIKNAQVTDMKDDLSYAQVILTPETGPTDERTSETLVDLREQLAAYEEDTGATYGVTGTTAIFDDISDRLQSVLVPYILIVVALAVLVLMVVFRSIWVPIIAALGFALSVVATFGITVAVYQEGALGIIDDPQPLLSFLPIMLIGLVFGLAMDYQVFLVTRMREGWAHGKTPGNATSNGFKHGARVVTAAALIMISVFAAFMLQDMPFIATMGFALAVAVLLDAFVVRMTIIPATMFLLQDHAWRIPRWLDKILPNVDVEGEALTHQTPQKVESA